MWEKRENQKNISHIPEKITWKIAVDGMMDNIKMNFKQIQIVDVE